MRVGELGHFLNNNCEILQLCLFLLIPYSIMKSKKLSLLLALFAGSSGADRFYLGQNNAGWATLLGFWAVLPALIYAIIKYNIFPNWEPFLLTRFALPIVFHLYAGGRYLVMNDTQFKSQDVSKSKTFLLTAVSLLVSFLLIIGGNKLLSSAQIIDITKVDAEVNLSAEEMSGEYRTDEEAYRKKYDNKVLQIEGTVTELGNDFEQGQYFALRGLNNDPFGIKCYFVEQNSADAQLVKIGDAVVIKGVGSGNKLENCKLVSVNGKKI